MIYKHRLKKKNPEAAISEAVEPIVYYLDRGAPEPVKSALLDGARWWNQAFEAIGYKDAFQVKLLPADADPMDVRYNLIQWVHRSTRGWSYGAAVGDPRTGEIIKGHVSLGSLRVRQDFLIATGLLQAYSEGNEDTKPMLDMALARIRQLSAHEVGHTLGLAHNFAASINDRSSVMDYPHPLIELDAQGNIKIDNAYDDKIGSWDKQAIAYGYQDFSKGANIDQELERIIKKGLSDGHKYITDSDARPRGGSHPYAHLWDNGKNGADELNRLLNIRKIALQNMNANNIASNAPMATLEETLVPIYLIHRYQIEAAAKLLGGVDYTYAANGDEQMVQNRVPSKVQKSALDALLNAISAETLDIPSHILALIPPRPPGYSRSRETFKSKTGVTFDPLTAAESAANMSIGMILNRERAARLVTQKAQDKNSPGLGDVINELINKTWKAKRHPGLKSEIQFVTENLVLLNLMQLASDDYAQQQVRAVAYAKLMQLKNWMGSQNTSEKASLGAHYTYALKQIALFEENPDKIKKAQPVSPPDGSPIGSGQAEELGCSYNH